MKVKDVTKFHKRNLGVGVGLNVCVCVCAGFHTGFEFLEGGGGNSKVRC